MRDLNPIGYLNPDGAPVYPECALNGRIYTLPPGTVHFISPDPESGRQRFVVLDGLPPKFDVKAAVAALEASPFDAVAPVAPEMEAEEDPDAEPDAPSA